MARGLCKVILIATLGADPETRYTANGGTITTFRAATTEGWTDKASGQKQERTEWHRVKCFGRLAEIAGEYLRKGRQVYVEGTIRSDKFTGQDGVEKTFFEIVANELQLLGGAPGERSETAGEPAAGSTTSPPRGANTSRPSQPTQSRAAPPRGPQRPAPLTAGAVASDDIPFAPPGRRLLRCM